MYHVTLVALCARRHDEDEWWSWSCDFMSQKHLDSYHTKYFKIIKAHDIENETELSYAAGPQPGFWLFKLSLVNLNLGLDKSSCSLYFLWKPLNSKREHWPLVNNFLLKYSCLTHLPSLNQGCTLCFCFTWSLQNKLSFHAQLHLWYSTYKNK